MASVYPSIRSNVWGETVFIWIGTVGCFSSWQLVACATSFPSSGPPSTWANYSARHWQVAAHISIECLRLDSESEINQASFLLKEDIKSQTAPCLMWCGCFSAYNNRCLSKITVCCSGQLMFEVTTRWVNEGPAEDTDRHSCSYQRSDIAQNSASFKCFFENRPHLFWLSLQLLKWFTFLERMFWNELGLEQQQSASGCDLKKHWPSPSFSSR